MVKNLENILNCLLFDIKRIKKFSFSYIFLGFVVVFPPEVFDASMKKGVADFRHCFDVGACKERR